jgi:predicted phage baseplate assembly protein
MTLVQLFAWLTDILLFRFNQVPELNYIKFLQLIGIERRPASPAKVDLTFTLSRPDSDTVLVPQRTRVAGPGSPPMVFETDEALSAIGPVLAAVLVYDGFAYTDVTKTNSVTGGQYFAFARHAHERSALLLGFDSPGAFPSPSSPTDLVDLMVYVHSEATNPLGVSCGINFARIAPPAVIDWQYWDGSRWNSLRIEGDQTRAFTQSGHVRVRLPDAVPGMPAPAVRKAKFGGLDSDYYWLRALLRTSQYERSPVLEQIQTNTVSATQAVTISDEVLGGSSGQPSQSFQLANKPVVVVDPAVPSSSPGADGIVVQVNSVQVEVDEGGGFLAWQEVPDFLRSDSNSPHFRVNYTTGEVLFGDARRGRIPLPSPANPTANIVARSYRSGGGAGGNFAPGKVNSLQSSLPGVSVSNPRAGSGGADEESVDDAKMRAPAELKSKGRAVTAEDFEILALEAPSTAVLRAKALPLYDPRFPDIDVPGVVTVIVVPAGDQPNPIPNETTLTTVCAYLDLHRLLTSEVHVVPPHYNLARITVEAVAKPQADVAEVTKLIRTDLSTYLHPLTGGDDGTGWDFGGTVYYSKLYRRIGDINGVDRIEKLVIDLDGAVAPACADVPINAHALVYTLDAQNTVLVSYGQVRS